jgi:hypothetical protein
MRRYVQNGSLGANAAADQIALLEEQQKRLVIEAKRIAVRKRYVQLKIDYWRAVGAGDEVRSAALADEARAIADELRK